MTELSNGYHSIYDVLFCKDENGTLVPRPFTIPSFQRGYRWTESNVKQLIDDIYEDLLSKIVRTDLKDENDVRCGNLKEYCIQPLVVMKDANDRYSVIDGQQRLITIVIILSAINNLLEPEDVDHIDIEFESRNETTKLLKTIYSYYNTEKNHNSINHIHENRPIDFAAENDIDHAYILQAYKIAYDYFSNLLGGPNEEKTFKMYVSNNTNKKKRIYKEILQKHESTLLHQTQFIWYDASASNTDPQQVFTNFNTGKIELTDSELIKAAIMTEKGKGKVTKDKQIVVAEKWNEIENYLHEAPLWAFIPHAEGDKQYENNDESTRIDVLFEYLIYSLNDKDAAKSIYRKKDSRNLYYAVDKWIEQQGSHDIYDIWKEISQIFSGLYELYHNDNLIYNMTALYILLSHDDGNKEETYKALRNVLAEKRGKNRENALKDLIYKNLTGEDRITNGDKDAIKKEIAKRIAKERYSSSNSNIMKLLITYNIALLNQAAQNGSRYDFISHKNQRWEREHIFAQNMEIKEEEWTANDYSYARNAFKILAGTDYVNYILFLYYTAEDSSFLKNLTNMKFDAQNNLKSAQYQYGDSDNRKTLSLEWKEDTWKVNEEVTESEMDTLADHARNVTKNYSGNTFFEALCRAAVIRNNAKTFLKHFKKMDLIQYCLDAIEEETKSENDEQKKQKLVENCEHLINEDNQSKSTNERIKMLEEKKENLQKEIRSYIVKPIKEKLEDDPNTDDENDKNSPFVNNLIDNSMGNMALLRGQENGKGGVSNKPFYGKRDILMPIIKKGKFVPIGTQLVFTGTFTGTKTTDPFWLPDSRLRYIKDMIEKISNFLA